MEYMKHKYSKRVYQVMTDHGPDHPYLSCHPFVRYIPQREWHRFFSPCSKPTDPQNVEISVLDEIKWEKRQMIREEPLVVKAPSPVSKPKVKRGRSATRAESKSEEYTLKDLCSELNTSPTMARKILRSKGKTAPEGGWRWANRDDARGVKKFLKKFL